MLSDEHKPFPLLLISTCKLIWSHEALPSTLAQHYRDSLEIEDQDLFLHPYPSQHLSRVAHLSLSEKELLIIFSFSSAADDFNNGVVLSHRPLRPNEMFEVQLDKLVDKWAGSLEIGVTTHSPTDLEFPSTMTNVR